MKVDARWAAVALAAILTAGTFSAGTATASPPLDETEARAVGATIGVVGRGFGHGRGMGQWGAYGYAVGAGWDSTRILDHYYGGTTAGAIPTDAVISTELRELSGSAAIGVEHRGNRVVSNALAGEYGALQAVLRPDGQWDINQAPTCAGPWTAVPGGHGVDPAGGVQFDIAGGADPATTSLDGMLGLCEPDNQTRYYRGRLLAIVTSSGTRAVNVLPMEAYLRGVVPHESPPSWGTAGGGAGMNALRAQAVAARSYAARQARYAWANTCDTQDCQVYRGAWAREPDGTIVAREFATTDQAIGDTAGVVRISSIGTIASTEYSSSTGGWTAGGAFPAVQDEGDDIAAAINPSAAGEHAWSTSIVTAAVEARYPALGTLITIDVTQRNGLGEFGGRVVEMILRGTAGDVTLSGNQFRSAFGLRSDWFVLSQDATCGSGGTAPPATGVPPADPTTFHPLTPTRILDTRDGTGSFPARLNAGCTLVLPVADRGGVPAGARAVTLNLTATQAAEDGYLTAYPCGGTPPDAGSVGAATSSLNFRPGVDLANLVTVPVGADGTVCIYAYRSVHVLADVAGWFGADDAGARFTGLTPARLLDTRDGTGAGGALTPVGPGGVLALDVVGREGVPDSGASGVVLNLTATETQGPGYLAAYPCDQPAYASALNYEPGSDIANQVVVPIDGGGQVCIATYSATHVVADVLGYYGSPGDGAGQRFTPLPPVRIVDTRSSVPAGATRVGAGTVLPVDVLGQGGVPGADVGSVTLNLTAADPLERGYLTAFPCGDAPPNASNVNHPAARAAANLVTVALGGDGRVCVFAYASTDVVIDISGYYAD